MLLTNKAATCAKRWPGEMAAEPINHNGPGSG